MRERERILMPLFRRYDVFLSFWLSGESVEVHSLCGDDYVSARGRRCHSVYQVRGKRISKKRQKGFLMCFSFPTVVEREVPISVSSSLSLLSSAPLSLWPYKRWLGLRYLTLLSGRSVRRLSLSLSLSDYFSVDSLLVDDDDYYGEAEKNEKSEERKKKK
jgi:hypothetical protein